MLANFLICGAAKAGTTWVYHLLRQHPDVFMSSMKEPHFFVSDSVGRRVHEHVNTLAEYKALFAGAGSARWRGEASVFYLYYHSEAIPKIIATIGRHAPIMIILRNPVERAYSAYLYAATYNPKENASFEESLELEASRMADESCSPMLFYTSVGRYDQMVAAYQDAFPRLGVFLFDDLVANANQFARNIFSFLNLALPSNIVASGRMNEGGREWTMPVIGKLLKAVMPRPLRKVAKGAAPGAYGKLRRTITSGLLMRPSRPLRAETRLKLCNIFRDDVHRLSERLKRDLSHWVEPE